MYPTEIRGGAEPVEHRRGLREQRFGVLDPALIKEPERQIDLRASKPVGVVELTEHADRGLETCFGLDTVSQGGTKRAQAACWARMYRGA